MNKPQLRSWPSIAAALTVGLALRCWFITHTPRIAGDTLVYGAIARNWIEHGVYGFVETVGIPQPTLIRLPGYPLFLAACFRLFGPARYTAVMYTQAAVDLLSCLLAAALARWLFGPRAGMAALWLAALCPFTASYVAAPLTETLTLFTIAAALYALERWRDAGTGSNRWLFIITLSLSYSILLRPEQGLLAAAILPAMLWITRRQRSSAAPVFAAALCILLPLIPWTLRNERTFHVFQPLAPRTATDPGEPISIGFQRWYRTWAIDFASTEDVYWNYDGGPIPSADLPTRAFDSPDQQARTQALLADYNETTSQSPELDARFRALAAERIAAHPLRSLLLLPIARLANMILRPRTEMFSTPLEWWKFREHPRPTLFAATYAALNLAYLTLAALGWLKMKTWGWMKGSPHGPVVAAMLACILLRCALLLTLDNSEPRYTLEFFPIVFVLAAGLWARRAT